MATSLIKEVWPGSAITTGTPFILHCKYRTVLSTPAAQRLIRGPPSSSLHIGDLNERKSVEWGEVDSYVAKPTKVTDKSMRVSLK